MNKNLIHELNKELLHASLGIESQLFGRIVDAIRKTMNCRMCSLWGINTNTTNDNFRSASIVVRKLESGIKYPSNFDFDFVHELDDCFIKDVLEKTEPTNQPFYDCTFSECDKHRSKEALKLLELNYFICIPIRQKNKTIALLKLSFIKNPQIDKSEIQSIAETIHEVILSCFERYMLYNKQQLITDLMSNYKRGKIVNFREIFYPILHEIFKKYFYYEGASVFILNSYNNHFNLLRTTGITIEESDTFHYCIGEGLTGKAAKEKKVKIYDDLIALEKSKNTDYKHKYKEETEHDGKTMLVLPILRPSNPDNVIGILRFTNKINKQSRDIKSVVDYFNDADIELIEYAAHYLALNIENFLGEEEREKHTSMVSHESRNLADAICVSADSIKRNIKDTEFMNSRFDDNIQSIINIANTQIMQASTNLFTSNFYRNTPKQYINKFSIKNVINDIISIIKTYYAVDKNIGYVNISVHNSFQDLHLRIDEVAFKMVFYNILMNAVKYVRPYSQFCVEFNGEIINDHIVIKVSDYGLGIDEKDKENIFLYGFRGDNFSRKNIIGNGIGLYVVKQILNNFEGEINVSHYFSPTTFEIKLPKKLLIDNNTNREV